MAASSTGQIIEEQRGGDSLRPRDLAVWLLAGGDAPPRRRARDQQADRAGLELKQMLLEQIVARDPEPEEVERTLMQIVAGLDAASGPARAVAATFLEEWRTAAADGQFARFLLTEALRGGERDRTEEREDGMNRRSQRQRRTQ